MSNPVQKNYSGHELIVALQNKEEQAMSFLYERYSKALFNIIYRVLQNQEMSEDVLQECFVKIWNGIAQYDGTRGSLCTWM